MNGPINESMDGRTDKAGCSRSDIRYKIMDFFLMQIPLSCIKLVVVVC